MKEKAANKQIKLALRKTAYKLIHFTTYIKSLDKNKVYVLQFFSKYCKKINVTFLRLLMRRNIIL